MSTTILSLALVCAAAPPVETSSTAETMLYVRTTPSGAEILVDGKSLGTAPGLFKVPPGVRRIVVELDGHEPDGGEVTIKAGHIRRLEFKLKRRPGRAAEGATASVTDVLNQWQAAVTELDFKKFEALFLPPDDTPAGKARRKDLEDAKEYFLEMKAAGVTAELWCVGIQQRRDGKDRIVSVTMVSRITSPAGEVEKREGAYQIRITPTPDGWKIAEAKLLDQPVVTPVAPAPRAERPRHEGRLAEGAEVKRKEAPDPVAGVLKLFEAAASELDYKKLEALFLPPDDTPAGKATREILEEAKWEWREMKARGVTAELRLVGTEQRQDGKDWIVSATQVGRLTIPTGGVEKREKPGQFRIRRLEDLVQFRITPTEDGWKIAEMKELKQPAEQRVTLVTPAPRAERQRHFVRIVVGRDTMSFEGEETTWALLPALLEKVPNRQSTVLEIAVASDDMTLKEKNDATGRASALARRFGFDHLSDIGVHPLGSKGSPTQIVPAKEAPSATQAPKKVHLPDADTPGAGVVLDLASGEKLGTPDRAASATEEPEAVFARLGKGDLCFDKVLGCLRGAKPMFLDGKRFVAMSPKVQEEHLAGYELPTTPCRLLITTAEKKQFDVTILAVTKDGGIDLEYRAAEGSLARAVSDERAVRDVVSTFVAATTKGEETAAPKVLLGPLASKTVLAQAHEMREVAAAGMNPGAIRSVTIGRGRALVVTEFARLADPKYAVPVCMVYTLVKQDGGWLIDDIDLEDAEGLADEIGRFDAEHAR